MTFIEALNEVVSNNKVVQRKMHEFSGRESGKNCGPWSSWIRMRMEDDVVPFDALVFIETNNHDDRDFHWVANWSNDDLSKEDILATDWEFQEE
jgi:hypothetical protein